MFMQVTNKNPVYSKSSFSSGDFMAEIEEFRQRERIDSAPKKKYRIKLASDPEDPKFKMRWFANKGVLPSTIQRINSLVKGEFKDLIALKCIDLLGMGVSIEEDELLTLARVLVLDRSPRVPFSLLKRGTGFLEKVCYRLPVFGLLEFTVDQNISPSLAWAKIVSSEEMIRGSPEEILHSIF